jgi:hypothetical protein
MVLSSSSFELLFNRLVDLLSDDPSYKVRIHSISVISSAIGIATANGIDSINARKARDVAATAKRKIQNELENGQVESKERRHAEVLLQKVSRLAQDCFVP